MAYKKRYTPYQAYKESVKYYAYHDIDMHKDEILQNREKAGISNMKYVIPSKEIGKNEISVTGFKNGSKVNIKDINGNNLTLVVNNKENIVNEFGVAINPLSYKDNEHNFNYDIVEVAAL